MRGYDRSTETTCPEYGALGGSGVKKCWLCGAALAELEDVGQKSRSFGATVGSVILIGVSSGIAFFATCVAGGIAGMAARLQVHKQCRFGGILAALAAILKSVDLRMGLAEAFVIPLSYDGSIFHDDRTDEGIGRNASGAALG